MRLATTFAAARAEHRAALVTFVTASDGPAPTILDALVAGGLDALGVAI